jgi:large subunit ribosomal protein L24
MATVFSRRRHPVERVRINLKKNDLVRVISGKDSGKEGKILKVIPEKNRVIVQGVAFVKRHTRPNPQRNIKGGIAEREGAIHASNVQLVCAECSKLTRVGHKLLADGKKVRVCAKCEGVLDK